VALGCAKVVVLGRGINHNRADLLPAAAVAELVDGPDAEVVALALGAGEGRGGNGGSQEPPVLVSQSCQMKVDTYH
jgi:hypothetical protein